jgi:hypothetical protein
MQQHSLKVKKVENNNEKNNWRGKTMVSHNEKWCQCPLLVPKIIRRTLFTNQRTISFYECLFYTDSYLRDSSSRVVAMVKFLRHSINNTRVLKCTEWEHCNTNSSWNIGILVMYNENIMYLIGVVILLLLRYLKCGTLITESLLTSKKRKEAL